MYRLSRNEVYCTGLDGAVAENKFTRSFAALLLFIIWTNDLEFCLDLITRGIRGEKEIALH